MSDGIRPERRLVLDFLSAFEMRLILLIVPIAALAACGSQDLATPAPQTAASGGAVPAATLFDVPMDPGLIQCDRLTNPAALTAASNWAIGQARTGVLSGRVAAAPDATVVSNNLALYCSANGGDTVRIAASQLGL